MEPITSPAVTKKMKMSAAGSNANRNSTDDFLAIIKKIVLAGLRPYKTKVYLFGSRATGDAMPGSDVDIGVDPLESLPAGVLSSIRENLEESTVPYTVDLIDLEQASKTFKNNVINNGKKWTS